MTLDHLRQQITIVMDDLPVLEAEAAACDDLARHLVVRLKIAAENATGCAILADADCYTSLATVLRSILEGLFVTYWASLNEENGQKILGSLKNEGARLLRNMLQSRRGVIRRKSTGDDVTGEFLKSDFIAEATRPNRINKMAEEAGLGELYFIFYSFLSMFVHGTAAEFLREAHQKEMISVHLEAARSMLKSLHLIVVNRIRLRRQTAREELEAILHMPL